MADFRSDWIRDRIRPDPIWLILAGLDSVGAGSEGDYAVLVVEQHDISLFQLQYIQHLLWNGDSVTRRYFGGREDFHLMPLWQWLDRYISSLGAPTINSVTTVLGYAAESGRRYSMQKSTVELSSELASDLNAVAKERGVTLRELVIHVLLAYLEGLEWEDDSGELDDEEDQPSAKSED